MRWLHILLCTHPHIHPLILKLYIQVGAIESPELVRALFDIYLGPDPVSLDAKKSFSQGLAALLRE